MSLQFLLGAGKHDHQQSYLQKAKEWLANDPENQVFFLVPNYNKFEQERQILSGLKQGEEFSTIRTQVFSFHRLAWYFLQQTGLLSKNVISEVGSAMIMRRVLQQLSEQLTIYRGEVTKDGFIQQLLSVVSELQMGNIQPEDLLIQLQSQQTNEADQQLKFKDLMMIYTAYQNELLERELQVENPIATLTRYLNEEQESFSSAPDLSKTLFIVTGFSSFNAQELLLLGTLMVKGALYVSLLLDRPYPAEMPSPLNLFREAGTAYFQLKSFAAENQIPVLFDEKAPSQPASCLTEVERLWRMTQNQEPFEQQQPIDDCLQIWKTVNPEEEIRQIGVEIRKLVAENPQLRYKDIQLLTVDPDLYGQLIPSVFNELDIPFYLDREWYMDQHPLVEFLQSLFAIQRYNYRLPDILRLLKTELFLPQELTTDTERNAAQTLFRGYIDQTENVALENNFQGKEWLRGEDWQVIRFDYEQSELEETKELTRITNFVRRNFRDQIAAFLQDLKTAEKGEDAVRKLYTFLINTGVEQQLVFWRNQDIEEGRLDLARNHEQTWNALMELMDDYLQIYGEDPFDFSVFQGIFSTGLESATYGKIPTALDQVGINRLPLARPDQAKITFAIGLNEQAFPQTVEERSLLTSEDRQRLNEQLSDRQYLRDEVSDALSQAPLIAYHVFLSATERLYLSYASNYDTHQNIGISPYINRLVTYLNISVTERRPLNETSQPDNYVGTYRNLITRLNDIYRQADDQKATIPAIWHSLENLLLRSHWAALAKRVFESRAHQNVPVSLSPELAKKLYGKDIYTSISRLESFYNCEFKYFSNFGLRLKERQIYGLNPMMTGEFFHDALDQFLSLLIERNLVLQEMNEQQREQFVDEILVRVFGEPRFHVMDSSARLNYIRYQLGKTVKKVTWALQKQSQHSHMSPIQTEVLFGQIAGQKGIAGLEFPLTSGGKLHVRGKIDRIDVAADEDNTWLSVVDYKSSHRQFDVVDAYYGLAMQLVTYLDVALTDAVQLIGTPAVKPGGAYYMHIHNPVLKPEETGEKDQLKKYQYDGLFVDDPHVFHRLDSSLEPKETSALFPLKMDKEGQLQKATKNSPKFYTEDELQLLIQHNRKQMQQAAEKIISGEIDLNPAYKGKERIACQFCPFRSICDFDVMLPENNYHRLEKLSKDDVMKRMEEEEND
ncbi:PD-(D/E)XK nuclease family protein [Enterococcus mediterraneensis]|uniref:PD-(D/E)XK nuclease family protein n=1 Tax=Enterococcus mediterraneensis TaxID=2364791 RepID=UPI000F04C781|nr:PD-(D/E)XK nuclease family protein [Enterococcus mediterraneensis]